jgi:hypothetical protein
MHHYTTHYLHISVCPFIGQYIRKRKKQPIFAQKLVLMKKFVLVIARKLSPFYWEE